MFIQAVPQCGPGKILDLTFWSFALKLLLRDHLLDGYKKVIDNYSGRQTALLGGCSDHVTSIFAPSVAL